MKLIIITVIFSGLLSACNMKAFSPVYVSSKTVHDYPSGSTISYFNGRFFIMGDDAAEILVLDSQLEEVDRIAVFTKGEEARLPKDSKADIESSVIITKDGIASIMFLGSGSLSPYRDSAYLFDPQAKVVERMKMKSFYDQLKVEFKDLNIEAATKVGDNLLIGIRANATHPDNYLVLANTDYPFKLQRKLKIRLPVGDAGISGLDYDPVTDILFLTFSTEHTINSFDDGKIGESYLGILTEARRLLTGQLLETPNLIKLSEIHGEFKDQKVESVSMTGEDRELVLVADDDQGNTKLFIIRY